MEPFDAPQDSQNKYQKKYKAIRKLDDAGHLFWQVEKTAVVNRGHVMQVTVGKSRNSSPISGDESNELY